jgi:hypothetical protein
VVVDDFETRDLKVVLCVRGQRGRVGDRVEAELHVTCRERLAVLPANVFTQVKRDLAPVLGNLPPLGQPRLEAAEVAIVGEHSIEDTPRHLVGSAVAGAHRDQVRGVPDGSEQDRVAVRRRPAL